MTEDDEFFVGATIEQEGNSCDFCGGGAGPEDAGKNFNAGDVVGQGFSFAPSVWFGCRECSALIDAGQWEDLARRASAAVAPAFREAFHKRIHSVHAAFRKSRILIQ
jgi:hypothetical protein